MFTVGKTSGIVESVGPLRFGDDTRGHVAQKPETRFKNRIRPLLNALPNSWWVKTSQRSVRGTPDLLGCVNGMFIALELKRSESARIDPLQEHNINKIIAARGLAFLVFPENWQKVFQTLQRLAGEENGSNQIRNDS